MKLARGLGWFSIGLGLLETLAPRWLTGKLGLSGREGLVRAYGGRELLPGGALLRTNRPEPLIWARLGGDALDIATLGSALGKGNPKRMNTLVALGMVLGVTALDVLCLTRLRRAS